MPARIGLLTLHLRLAGCTSLKEKRGRLKPLINRMHRQFNLSVAEVDRQDAWQEAVVACTAVGNEAAFLQASLQTALRWVQANWPDGDVLDTRMEIL